MKTSSIVCASFLTLAIGVAGASAATPISGTKSNADSKQLGPFREIRGQKVGTTSSDKGGLQRGGGVTVKSAMFNVHYDTLKRTKKGSGKTTTTKTNSTDK